MPTICPKDSRACPDDLCRGAGICAITRTEMLDRCNLCGQVYSDDVDCACEPDDWHDDGPMERQE